MPTSARLYLTRQSSNLIPYNPAAEVERPKKDNFVASYYSADELMEVLPIFANTKMELPVMLAAFYGLRRSEVIGLQWSAIDFERENRHDFTHL